MMPRPTQRSLSSLTSQDNSAYSMTTEVVDPDTEMAAWFVSGMPRAEVKQMASDMLKNGTNGNFLIRDVQSEPHCYGLSIKVQSKMVNYLIESKDRQYRVRGTKSSFDTVYALVQHYASEKRAALGIRLVPADPEDFMMDESSDSDTDSDEDSASHSALTDKERWARNAQHEEERTFGRSQKNKKKRDTLAAVEQQKQQVASTRSKQKPTRTESSQSRGQQQRQQKRGSADQPRPPAQPRGSSDLQMGAKPPHATPPHAPPHNGHMVSPGNGQGQGYPQQGMPHPSQQYFPQPLSPQGYGPGYGYGAPPAGYGPYPQHMGYPHAMPHGYGPLAGLARTPSGSSVSGAAAPDVRMRAAEVQLAMMRAESELYSAQLRAAEAAMEVYVRRVEDDMEQSKYEEQARAVQRGDFSSRKGKSAAASTKSSKGAASKKSKSRTAAVPASESSNRSSKSLDEQADELEEQARMLEREVAELAMVGNTLGRSDDDADRDSDVTPTQPDSEEENQPAPVKSIVRSPPSSNTSASNGRRDTDPVTRAARTHARGSKVSFSTSVSVVAPSGKTTTAPARAASKTKKSKKPKEDRPKVVVSRPNYTTEQLEVLRRIEQQEMDRRAQFDKKVQTMMTRIRSLPPSERVREEMELDRIEAQEVERRKEWERGREEREARYIMNHPSVGEDLEAYLAEIQAREEELQRQKQAQDDAARSLVGKGRVKQLAAAFQEGPTRDGRKKDHVMTWRVKDASSFPLS